jgi:2,3-bisphosphoglycerate-independent phosphoglycerate mutase
MGMLDKTNPIYLADTPVWDRLTTEFPNTRLEASGSAVGLLDWKAGNSEAGHQAIGAGRIVLQDDVRIEMAIKDNSFFSNPAFASGFANPLDKNGAVHLIALLSDKSSRGSIKYPIALLRLAKEKRLRKISNSCNLLQYFHRSRCRHQWCRCISYTWKTRFR